MRQSNDRQVGVRGRQRQRDAEEGSTVSVVKTKDKWRALSSRKLKVRIKDNRKKKTRQQRKHAGFVLVSDYAQVHACAHKRMKKKKLK